MDVKNMPPFVLSFVKKCADIFDSSDKNYFMQQALKVKQIRGFQHQNKNCNA